MTQTAVSPYIDFTREEWAALHGEQELPLTEDDLRDLRGFNEDIDLDEVRTIYLPLTRLLQLYIDATRNLYHVTDIFLGHPAERVPYVIGIAGSVAAGKSTSARLLQVLLAHAPGEPRVELVTTDGFLFPNRVLEERGLMKRKGFPESYDLRKLVRFMRDIKSGCPTITIPVYSHLHYDIVPDTQKVIEQPDIVIVEGLNMLQSGADYPHGQPRMFVSDFFDFSIYVDADEHLLQTWYVERFLRLRDTAFRRPESYFRRYAALTRAEAVDVATGIWNEINLTNLHQNIAPTRERARLILEKGAGHEIQRVYLRKL